jgi:regulatory protein
VGSFAARPSRTRGGQAPEPPDDLDTGPDADPVDVARQICLHQLEHAPRTRAELAAVLAKRGVADEVADEVLERFTDVGLIDDAAFAQQWTASRQRSRGLATRAIGQELRRKGVDDEVVRETLAQVDPLEEEATARTLVDRKLRTMRGLAPEAKLRRLTGMLARKGYSAGVAYRVVKEALAEEGLDLVLDTDGLSALD